MPRNQSPGRPKKITDELIEKVIQARNKDVTKTWKQIGKELGINPSTAAVVFNAHKRAK